MLSFCLNRLDFQQIEYCVVVTGCLHQQGVDGDEFIIIMNAVIELAVITAEGYDVVHVLGIGASADSQWFVLGITGYIDIRLIESFDHRMI